MGRRRYGRSMHWLSQPRGLDGRFQSSGGSNEPDPLNEWFLKAPWWQKILALLGFGVFAAWLVESGYVLVFIIVAWVLIWIMKLIV